ncbi:MAG TPA: hypothetical protein VFY50_03175, partial [Candidatus Nitrosocosmicus sp.]|nr:hypothetical protein [Candidatus Nitrosocosmicus sp.]
MQSNNFLSIRDLFLCALTLIVLLGPNTFSQVFSSFDELSNSESFMSGQSNFNPRNDSSILINSNSSSTTVLKASETGMEPKNIDNWIFVNHDSFGTRNSNQTEIGKSNINNLELKWRLNNTYEIQEPPIIIGNMGYFQDYIGNIVSFDTLNGNINWKLETKGGPTMGLYYSEGLIYAT